MAPGAVAVGQERRFLSERESDCSATAASSNQDSSPPVRLRFAKKTGPASRFDTAVALCRITDSLLTCGNRRRGPQLYQRLSPGGTSDSRGSSATGPDLRSKLDRRPVWFRALLCGVRRLGVGHVDLQVWEIILDLEDCGRRRRLGDWRLAVYLRRRIGRVEDTHFLSRDADQAPSSLWVSRRVARGSESLAWSVARRQGSPDHQRSSGSRCSLDHHGRRPSVSHPRALVWTSRTANEEAREERKVAIKRHHSMPHNGHSAQRRGPAKGFSRRVPTIDAQSREPPSRASSPR